MRYYIIATHGYFAQGIVTSIEMIIGEQPALTSYCAYTEEKVDFKAEISKQLEGMEPSDEVVIITDIYGGSVNNEMLEFMKDSRVHLVTGLSLPLAIQLLLSDPEEPAAKAVEEAIELTKENIMYCNKTQESGEDLDEF